MFSDDPSQRGTTDSLQHILKKIPDRARDRGLGVRIADDASIAMLALWSVLLWEHKLGLVALEHTGLDRFGLVRDLDRLLEAKAAELPDFLHEPHTLQYDAHERVVIVDAAGHQHDWWDSDALLAPLLFQADHEAKELGHNYIGSEHLMLAIVKLTDPALTTLLQQHGVDHGKVKKAVVDLLRPPK